MLQTECVAFKFIHCNPSTRYEEEGSLGHVCGARRVLVNGMSGLIWRHRELAPFHWSLPCDEKTSLSNKNRTPIGFPAPSWTLGQNFEKQMHVPEATIVFSPGSPCRYLSFNPQDLPAECRFWFCLLPGGIEVCTGKYISQDLIGTGTYSS